MDENNVNPKPLESAGSENENENTQPLTSESEVITEGVQPEQTESAEKSEYEQFVENSETSETEEVAVNDSESADAENEEAVAPVTEPAKKKRKGAVVAIVLLIILMVSAIGAMVAVIIGSSTPKIDLEQIALSVDDVDSSAAEFYQAYMYYYSYNSYYQYTEEELKELAVNELVLTNTLYTEAIEKGYTVDDEIQAQIDEQLASVTMSAESASMTADEYLDEMYCPGFTLDMFKTIAEKSLIAQAYYTDEIAKIEEQYNGDEGKAKVEAEYAANKLDYDLTDVSYWYFDAAQEDAQTNADAIVAQVNSGKTFTQAIQSVTSDPEAIPNNLKGHSKAALENGEFAEAAIEWIFATSEDGSYTNGTGAITTVADDSVIYVFYVNNAPHRNEVKPVTAYYIQVDVSTDDSIKTEKELQLQAKSAADAIIKEFEATDKSVESFSELLTAHDDSDDELVSGDVFENMENDGSADAAVEAWLFDEARKTGDYAIVEGDGCYYILYYAQQAENPVWFDSITESLITNDAGSWQTSILEKGEEKTVKNDDVINEVVAYVAELVASQYAY